MSILPDSLLNDPIEEYKTNILPSKTYKLDLNTHEIIGYVDGLDAVKQAVFLILNTERFKWFIFPDDDYGTEFDSLRNMPIDFVLAHIEGEVKDALSIDTRILNIGNFEFDVLGSTIHCTFTVECIFGKFDSDLEIDVS